MNDEVNSREMLRYLYDVHADDVFRYAVYTLMNDADAKDVVQEVFLRAHRSWDSFRGEATAKTWLFRIARNYMHDVLRKRKTERRYQQVLWEEQNAASAGIASDLEVHELLGQLPERYRQVLLLRAVEGFSVAETSRILRLSETNVRVTYHRAKKLLEQLLQEPTGQSEAGVKGGWV